MNTLGKSERVNLNLATALSRDGLGYKSFMIGGYPQEG